MLSTVLLSRAAQSHRAISVLAVPLIDLEQPDHAYSFGFVHTDGHLYAGKGQKGRLSIEVPARDDGVLHAFSALFPVYSSIRHRDRTTNFGPYRSAVWTVCDLAFRRELVELGLPPGRKSTTITPPNPPVSARDYLRGVIDGDGSMGFTRTGKPFIGLVTASEALAQFSCAQILEVVGAHRTAARNTRDGLYNLMVAGDPAAPLAAWLYPEGCLALDRKRKAAADVAAWTRPVGMRARPEFGCRRWTAEEDADVFTGSVQGLPLG